MTFNSGSTGTWLRSQGSADDPARAMQALAHGYGCGSKAALASLLLGALGGSTSMGKYVDIADGPHGSGLQLKQARLHRVDEPDGTCSNDVTHDKSSTA